MQPLRFLRSYGVIYVLAVFMGVYCAIYGVLGVAPSAMTQFVMGYGVATYLAMWASLDARTRRSTPCYDFGLFVFYTWYFTVPCYLIVTRGWRGALVVLTVLMTAILAVVALALLAVCLPS